MWLAAITAYSTGEYAPDQDEIEDGEVSIVFWSCAFVILLIVTVWFYITEIAPMRRAAGRKITDEEIDREEEVAKRILEHLSDDLQFKSDTSEEDVLKNAASALSVKKEKSSIYEYIDDEIHIHYSNYGWDDECDESSDFSSGLGAARRRSMENMDLIFPGFLPSIVEEEEIDEETDTESSEKSQEQDTDADDIKFNNLSNLPTVYKPVVNNNADILESSVNGEYHYPEKGDQMFPFIESQESRTKESKRKEDSVIICEPAGRYSLTLFENVNNVDTMELVPEPVKTNQNGSPLLSGKSDNRSQVTDTESCKRIPSAEPASYTATQESVIPTKCPSVEEATSGSIDVISDKDQKKTTRNNLFKVNGDVIESTSIFTISNCDLAPALKQDANEIEEPKLCASNEQKISCPVNGLDAYFTRDIRSKNLKNDENAHDNIGSEPDSELSDASSDDTSGLAGIKMDVNKSGIAEFHLNGFVDEITRPNDHTTHAWTFFSMSGNDETTAPPVKGISNDEQQSNQVEVPKIIIDSYDDGLRSDNLSPNENSMDMNANATYGDSYEIDTFETDIDIDDVDLIDSDELEEEGEFSIYFKRHVSVTDLDKILSEEGQTEVDGDSSKEILETELSVEEQPQVEGSVDVSTTRTVTSEQRETNNSHSTSETEYIDDGFDVNIQKSIIVTSKLSDCLDKQPTLTEAEQLEEIDSLLKNYAVETLIDDVSFQKDGVYGELVLSKLNENLKDQPDDVSLDSYGEDWSGFAEEYRIHDRRPLLYTIPEEEEIGPPVHFWRENNLWGQTRFNYSNDNESSAAKEPGEKAPIATMDASDSEYDLDDHSSSETEISGEEDIEEKDRLKTPDKPGKTISFNGVPENSVIEKPKSDEIVSLNGVTEKPDIGGVRDAIDDKLKRSEESELLEKIPTYNGVTSNGGNNVALDNTRSVKIVKKVKIFVRKEVMVAKDDQELVLSPKQLIEDFGDQLKDKTDTGNETSEKKEVEEAEIILECSQGKTHNEYDVIKEENGSVTNFTQPLNFEEEHCNISEVNAKKVDTIVKKEDYTPPKPELKVVDEVIETCVSSVAADAPVRDVTQYFKQPPGQSDQAEIDAKAESKIVDEINKARQSPVEEGGPKIDFMKDTGRDITQHAAKPSEETDQTKAVDKSESKTVDEGTKPSPVEANTPVRGNKLFSPTKTKQKHLSRMVARFESKIEAETIKARRSSLEAEVPKPDVTHVDEKLPAQRDQGGSDVKRTPEIVKERKSSVEGQVQSLDVTHNVEKLPAQRDQGKSDVKRTPEIAKERKSSVEAEVPKLDVTHNVEKLPAQRDQAKNDAKLTPEPMKASAPSVEVPKRDVTQHAEKPERKNQTKIEAKPEPKLTAETTKTSASSEEVDVPKLEVALSDQTKIGDKPESKPTPETIKRSALPVLAEVTKHDATQHLEKLPEPESKVMPQTIKAERVTQHSEKDQTKINAKPESKPTPETIKRSALPVLAEVTKHDATQHLEKLPEPESKVMPQTIKAERVTQHSEKDQTKINAKPESKSTPETVKTKALPVEAKVPKREDTQKPEQPTQSNSTRIEAELESKSTPEIIKASVPKRGEEALTSKRFTEHAEILPAQRNVKKIDTKPKSPETVKTYTSLVKAKVSKIDITAQNDQTKLNAQPKSKIVDEVIEARVSTVEAHTPERDIMEHFVKLPTQNEQTVIDGEPESKIAPEKIESIAASVEAVGPNRGITKDFAKLPPQNDQTKIDFTEKVTKNEVKDTVEEKPARSNVALKLFISGKSNKEPETAKKDTTANNKEPVLSDESEEEILQSPPVKISVQGKDSEEEGRRVRSPTRISPRSWEKKTKKTYLASRNIRLTKSHEDLRSVEAPGGRQDSIEEEETIAADLQSPDSILAQTIPEDDAIESVEQPSIHTAKITVQEVVGDKQRILILNVRKKVQGRARWKSLNDLDSIKKAVTPPRRSSDLGDALASFAEEEEKAEGNKGPKILPIVEVRTSHLSNAVPEVEETRSEEQVVSPRRSPILKVTALQDRESIPENDTPIVIKARVMPVLHEGEPHEETGSEIKDKDTPRREFKARVSQASPRDSKSWVEREEERIFHAAHGFPVVEAIPRLERETVTEISNPSTKGNKIKVHVAHVKPTEGLPPRIDDKVSRPQLLPIVKAIPLRDDHEIEARTSQVSPIMEARYRRGRESGYGSLEMKDNDARSPNGLATTDNVRLEPVSTLGGTQERSVSSVSSFGSIEDEYDGEILGESRVMVTDLDALLAQQSAAHTREKPRPRSPETHEVTEKVHVWARMEPVPERVVRINSEEKHDDDSLVIRHVQTEEPIVIEPVVVTEAAPGTEESNVISAFLVNDGYDDEELDEVFLEEYPPYGDSNDPTGSSTLRHSSDADSETSSVSSLPLKHRHRHTRASLENATSAVRSRTDSSGSSKTATPVAELENEKAATSSGSSTPEMKASETFSFKTPQQSPPAAKEKPTKFTSAFITLSRTTEVRRPRARSEHSAHKSDEEPSTVGKGPAPNLQKKGLGSSVQDVQTMPGLDIDKQRFKEAADSRKSMPDLTKKEHHLNDSPFLRGLSAHTRRWLSQNAWMDSSEQQDQEDVMTSDLFLYPSNRFQPGSNIDASFMSLAGERGERDFPDDISVSTLSTRPQSPMSEFSFAGETPYWGMRRGSTTTIKCSNPRCEKEEVLFAGEKTTYTSCPACFTYYCSRGCRRFHWSEHKKICFFGRINSYIRSFIYLCHKKEVLKNQLSKAAREGFKRKGRGCVLVTFASPQLARKFMTTGCTFFPSPPTYSSLQDLQAEGVVSKHRVALTQNIKDYNPEEEFVLNLAIIAGKMENLPANPIPRRKVNTVLQVIKIPLSSKVKETTRSPAPNDPKTETKVFYLPKCARHEFVNENEARRHYCRNISKNLKQYGIKLKNDYPDVYEKLCLYVDQNIHFKEPLVVYGNQGKKIVMCKIMPEAGDEVKKN